jgi:DNA modification methylase
MHYNSWSHWGNRGDIWINSSGLYAFNDAENFQTIPCTGELTTKQFSVFKTLVEDIIVTSPPYSQNYESEKCNDEPQARFLITYGPKGTSQKDLELVSEDFSLWARCNDKPIYESWEKLSKEVEKFATSHVSICKNSPF